MTILHVYDEGNAMAGRYVEMLMQATQAMVGAGSLFDEPITMFACTNANDCRRLTDEHRPDILHLHGASAPFTLPAGLRLVVTPHGEAMGPVRAYVLIARSPHEASSLQKQSPRVETVRNPQITRTVSPQLCAKQMATVYRRVMDSNVLQLLDTDTRHLLTAALAVATYGDVRWLPSTIHFAAEKVHYRLLYIYATNEGVLPLVLRGLEMLGVHAPKPEPVDGYLPVGYQPPQPMPVATISELLSDISAHGPSLLRMSELARALHNDNLDEELLIQQLDENDQHTLLSALLPLLAEHVLLTDGFMPCQPVEGPATQQLRTWLSQRQDI